MALEVGIGDGVAVNVGMVQQVAVGAEHVGFAEASGSRYGLQPAVGVVRVVAPFTRDIVVQLGQIAVGIVHGGETVVAVVRNGDDAWLFRRDGGDEIALGGLDDRTVFIIFVGGDQLAAIEHSGQGIAVILVEQRIATVVIGNAGQLAVNRTLVGDFKAVGACQPILCDEDELSVAGFEFGEVAIFVVCELNAVVVCVADLCQTPVLRIDLVHGPSALPGGILKDGLTALEGQSNICAVFTEILAVCILTERVNSSLWRVEGYGVIVFLLQAILPVCMPTTVVHVI